jgi:hypothetical protein
MLIVRLQYEDEKNKRIEMENMVKLLQEGVQALRSEISAMKVANEKMVSLLSKASSVQNAKR